ncbi:SUCO (predicted) [Pycnogonum litorale]
MVYEISARLKSVCKILVTILSIALFVNLTSLSNLCHGSDVPKVYFVKRQISEENSKNFKESLNSGSYDKQTSAGHALNFETQNVKLKSNNRGINSCCRANRNFVHSLLRQSPRIRKKIKPKNVSKQKLTDTQIEPPYEASVGLTTDKIEDEKNVDNTVVSEKESRNAGRVQQIPVVEGANVDVTKEQHQYADKILSDANVDENAVKFDQSSVKVTNQEVDVESNKSEIFNISDVINSESSNASHPSNRTLENEIDNVTETTRSVVASTDANDTEEQPEHMPSFDEWKKQRLEEQEKTGHNVPKAKPNSNNKVKPKSKINKNYASMDCGAKVLATNTESHHSSHVLNAFRDEYMLNPCNVKIWFIVELCESIQPHTLELANFELFSSIPNEFAVYSSERYPTREWTVLGIFHGKDERAIQEFSLSGHTFGKYIKVELSSHHGSEHYCPISLFRVYGTSMVEEMESMETPEAAHTDVDDDEDSLHGHGGNSNGNLFGSATSAVLQIVKNAAKALTGQEVQQSVEINGSQLTEEKRQEMTGSSGLSDQSKSELNETSNTKISNLFYELNKTLVLVRFNNSLQYWSKNFLKGLSKIFASCVLCSSKFDYPRNVSPVETSFSCRYLQAVIGPIKYKIFCQIFKAYCIQPDYEQNLMANYFGNNAAVLHLFKKYFCSSVSTNGTYSCLPNKFINSVSKSEWKEPVGDESDMSLSDVEKLAKNSSSLPAMDSEHILKTADDVTRKSDIPITQILTKSIDVASNSETMAADPSNDKSTEFPDVLIPSFSTKSTDSTLTSNSEYDVANVNSTEPVLSSSVTSTINDLPDTQVKAMNISDIDPTESININKVESSVNTSIPAVTVVESGVTENKVTSSASSITVEPIKQPDAKVKDEDTKNVTEEYSNPAKSTESSVTDSTAPNVSGNELPSENMASSSQSIANDQQQQPSSNGNQAFYTGATRESVFMRLNNRIKSLELNLSLSSQYLEELSKRYRKQMDEMNEMRKAFNKSVSSLNQTMQRDENKTIHLENRINILQEQLMNLTDAYFLLIIEKENMASTLIEWHMILVVVELVAMTAIFVTCLHYHLRSLKINNKDINKVVISTPNGSVKCDSQSATKTSVNPLNKFKASKVEDLVADKENDKLIIFEPTLPVLVDNPSINKARKKSKHKKHSRSNSNDLKYVFDSSSSIYPEGHQYHYVANSAESCIVTRRRHPADMPQVIRNSPAGLLFRASKENLYNGRQHYKLNGNASNGKIFKENKSCSQKIGYKCDGNKREFNISNGNSTNSQSQDFGHANHNVNRKKNSKSYY